MQVTTIGVAQQRFDFFGMRFARVLVRIKEKLLKV